MKAPAVLVANWSCISTVLVIAMRMSSAAIAFLNQKSTYQIEFSIHKISAWLILMAESLKREMNEVKVLSVKHSEGSKQLGFVEYPLLTNIQ